MCQAVAISEGKRLHDFLPLSMGDTSPSRIQPGPSSLALLPSWALLSKPTIWTRAALSPLYNLGGGSWFTATHKSGLVQNNQPTSLGLVWTGFFFFSFFKAKTHVDWWHFFFFCRFMLILMNCLCKNKSFIPLWILFRWLWGKSHYFSWNDLSFQIVEYNWKLKTVRTE